MADAGGCNNTRKQKKKKTFLDIYKCKYMHFWRLWYAHNAYIWTHLLDQRATGKDREARLTMTMKESKVFFYTGGDVTSWLVYE